MNANKPVPERDDEGYLLDPEDWTPELARELAAGEGLELGDEHWLVLDFIRNYQEAHHITPDIRHAAKRLGELTGRDKKQGKARIFELFPYGYVKQACKIAGMRRPRAWSTG
ncbi:MAG: TusE/DsrC/DsvC family sulfur relay protein [Gammaproteobacteria bacterium]|jgi:tRNA 2-thiouridine synthesizing protein E